MSTEASVSPQQSRVIHTVASDRIDGGGGFELVSDWAVSSASTHPPVAVTIDGAANDGRPGEGDRLEAGPPGRQALRRPKLAGLKLAAARRKLAKAGCKVKVRYAKSRRVRRGRVIKATAGAGKRLLRGARVTITVSRGACTGRMIESPRRAPRVPPRALSRRGTVRRPMTPPTPTQLAWRARVETVLRLAAPALDLLLAAGDRLSRIVEPDDTWDPPTRPANGRGVRHERG
jgi:hypothetical protein